MSGHNFLNLHVLISHSPSCLNRDDANMQKSAIFGGVRRVRVSSQSLKRAIRHSDAYRARLGEPSIRTNKLDSLTRRFAEQLAAEFPEDLVARVVNLIARDEPSEDDSKKPKKGAAAGDEAKETKLAVAPWSISEVRKICELVQNEPDAKKVKKLFDDGKGGRLGEEVRQVRASLRGAVDIALSGRMTTAGIMMPVDGAVSVAHAITTHAVDADLDWFTAVDDLVVDAGEVGAGHLNTQEFSSGVFYRYASVNLGQLQTNLGDASRADALDIAAHFAYLLATVVPEAKQRTFAAHNLADFVMASFADIPVSGANAFEAPIRRDRDGGFLNPSIAAFENYIESVRTGYGLDESHAVFTLRESKIEPKLASMAELENWIRADGTR